MPTAPLRVGRLCLSSVLLVGAIALAGASSPLGTQDDQPEEKQAEGPKRGTIIREAVNPYRFQPKEDGVTVDAATVNLRKIFEDLGPDATEWYQHVQTLSNPWFEGRAPGSKGHDLAIDYVEWWMKQYGLAPAFGGASAGTEPSYRQPFELTGRERQVRSSNVSLAGKSITSGTEYAVMSVSASGAVSGSLAFAGYAISAGEEGYTSFDGDDDIKERIVIFLRYEPLDQDGKSKWAGSRFSQWSNLAGKLDELQKRGAAAIIMVNPPGAKEGKTGLEGLRSSRWGNDLKIPFIQITAGEADSLVKLADPEGRDLLTLRKACDEGALKDFAMKSDVRVSIETNLGDAKVPTANVGGVLAGKGSLKDEWIVIGGHFDHVGYGLFGADPSNRGRVHPGADDNASGTAGVLLVSKQLKKTYDEAPAGANLRSILFIGFSAEESGLDGSRHWVKNPTIPADRINVMLNMDMIGRLRSDTLSVGGVDSADNFGQMIDPLFADSGLEIHADPSGRGPSDHASFYNSGVPVLFFFTGTHDAYHKPGDHGWTVNPAGAMKIVNLVRKIALAAGSSTDRLVFKSSEGVATPDRGYAGVRLGVMPAMGDTDVEGVLVESVSAETSAAEAGIMKGDVLVTWNGKELTSTGDMMSRLREHKPGDEVVIKIMRDGKDMEVTVKLKASKPRE
jgi:Peptidase family M28/PDZ domain/PA domain